MLKILTILLTSVNLHQNEPTWPNCVVGSLLQVAGGASAACAGTRCGMCERRFGCLTESWGRCCVQFFQLNGKRSLLSDRRAILLRNNQISRRSTDYDAQRQRMTSPWRAMRGIRARHWFR